MTSFPRRARAVARLASCLLLAASAACTGHNDGGRDSYGGSSNGAGGQPMSGPLAGYNTDTTTAPSGAATPAAAAPAGAPASPGAAAPAAGATKAP